MSRLEVTGLVAVALAAGYLTARAIFGPPEIPVLMVIGFPMMCVGVAMMIATRTKGSHGR